MLISRDGLHNKYYAALRLDALSVAALAAAVYFFDLRTLAALVCAAAMHELGHIACLRVFGLRLAGFRTEAQGLCIEYTGTARGAAHAVTAAGGPAAGLALAYAASWAGAELLSGVSLLLTIFNLLPILPLDGGRIMQHSRGVLPACGGGVSRAVRQGRGACLHGAVARFCAGKQHGY